MPEEAPSWPGNVGPKDVPAYAKNLPGFVVTSFGNDVTWLEQDEWEALDEILEDLDNVLAGHPSGPKKDA